MATVSVRTWACFLVFLWSTGGWAAEKQFELNGVIDRIDHRRGEIVINDQAYSVGRYVVVTRGNRRYAYRQLRQGDRIRYRFKRVDSNPRGHVNRITVLIHSESEPRE